MGRKLCKLWIRENDEGLNDITALFLHYQKALQKNDDNKGQKNERDYEYKWPREHRNGGIRTPLLKRHVSHSTEMEMEKEIFIWN